MCCFNSNGPLGGGVFPFEVVKLYVVDEPLGSSLLLFRFLYLRKFIT